MQPGNTPGEFATITEVTPGTVPQTPGGGYPRGFGPSRRLPHQQSDAIQTNSQRPQLQRGQSQIQQIAHNTIASSAKFVGIPFAERSPDLSDWDSRRLRFLNKRYKLKEGCVKPPTSHHDGVESVTPTVIDTPSVDARLGTFGSHFLQRSTSQESRPRLDKKDSVLKVAYDTVSSLIKRGTVSRPKPRHAPLASRSSFDTADLDDLGPAIATSPTIPPVPEETSEAVEEEEGKPEEPVKTTDAEWIELPERPTSFAATRALSHARRRRAWGLNSMPILYDDEGNPMARPRHCFAALKVSYGPEDEADVQDKPPRKSKSWAAPQPQQEELEPLKQEGFIEGLQDSQQRTHLDIPYLGPLPPDVGSSDLQRPPARVSLEPRLPDTSSTPDRSNPVLRKPSASKLSRQEAISDADADAKQRVTKLLDSIATAVVPHKQPRFRGVTPIGRLFNHHLGKTQVKKLDPELQEMLEKGEDHRPFFTYWVTTVQTLVFVISLATYGVGPFGLSGRVERSDEVPDTSLASRRVSYYEPTNIWFGPSMADLVRLGAKYSPCMRRERDVWKVIEMERRKENDTACCIFNDRTGCYQTTENGCPRALATWVKWSKPRKTLSRSKSDSHLLHPFNEADVPTFNTITHHRSAGAVCGQDPDFCTVPRSVYPREWADDLTKWPICKEPRTDGALPPHMTCQITGRPCCIQMQGLCRITTKEYCDFVQGYWHSNATLCSQVDCFGDICGMLPFVSKDHPNQFYRLFTSLFIHAGLIHLCITFWVHRFFMMDLETLIGWKRMALVYIGSGIGGNLASAIFVPYNPEVGPSGSQLGILAAMIVDVIHHRRLITNWKNSLAEHLVMVIVLFTSGLVPFIDNWAHIFGFIFGLLITMSIFPYLDFTIEDTIPNKNDMPASKIQLTVRRRTILVILSSVAGFCLFGLLCFIYFFNMEINCPYCGYLNCVNILMYDHYCDNKGLELSHWLPI